MARLTQQKYDLTCALMKLGFEIHSGNEHLLFAAVDAYAVARESREIAELKAQVEGLKTDMQHSRLIEAAQVKESNELKAQIRNYELRIDSDAVELDKRYSERTELNAEIKRLREFAQQCQKSPEKLVKMNWFEDGSFDYCDLVPLQDAAANVLSPAPVTEGVKKTFSLQMYECNRCEWYGQVGESIETESYDVCPKCLSEDLTLLDSPKNEDQE